MTSRKGRFGVGRDWLERHAQHSGDECLIWPFSRNNKGYGRVRIDNQEYLAHRVMAALAHGATPTPQHFATHSCGKGHTGCVNPRHLRWATPKENQSDRVTHGTSNRGERCAASRLSRGQVLDVVRRLHSGETCASLARELDVNYVTIHDIKNGRSWQWLTSAAA